MTSTDNNLPLGAVLDWQSIDIEKLPALTTKQVHIWCIPLELDEAQITTAESQLNPMQQGKYRRRAVTSNQKAYLAGRFYLHKLLAVYTGTTSDKINLSYSRLNKPSLDPNPNNLQFNFTDTKFDDSTIGIYAFTQNKSVGVDIEHLQRQSNFQKIAENRFCQQELKYAQNLDGTLDPKKVLAIWTRKEAYGKACGVGINFRMCQLNLSTNDAHQTSFESAIEPHQTFQLQQFYVGQQHIAAIAYEGDQVLEIKAFSLTKAKP